MEVVLVPNKFGFIFILLQLATSGWQMRFVPAPKGQSWAVNSTLVFTFGGIYWYLSVRKILVKRQILVV